MAAYSRAAAPATSTEKRAINKKEKNFALRVKCYWSSNSCKIGLICLSLQRTLLCSTTALKGNAVLQLYQIKKLFSPLFRKVNSRSTKLPLRLLISNGVEDTRLEAKAKDTKNPRPRTAPAKTGTLEAKAKDQGHKRKCFPKKKKKVFQNFFSSDLKKKVFKKFFQAISKKTV